MTIVYDAGVLIAAEGNDRGAWADHLARLELGIIPRTTAPVVAQVSRSPRQVPLRRFLRGCQVLGFAPEDGHAVGALLGRTSTGDVIDAHLVLVASRLGATVLTGDSHDLARLADALEPPVAISGL